jgi:hypothetical protein
VTTFGVAIHVNIPAAICIVTLGVLAFIALRFNPLALICWTRALRSRR